MTSATIVIWQAPDGWRWYVRVPNGRTVAESGEAFTRLWSAKRAAKRENRWALANGPPSSRCPDR